MAAVSTKDKLSASTLNPPDTAIMPVNSEAGTSSKATMAVFNVSTKVPSPVLSSSLAVTGRAVEVNTAAFPEKVNAEFVDVVDRTHARRRVFMLRCLDERREAAFSFLSCNF